MRKVLTLEVWEDETIEDSKECVNEVIKEAMSHCYCSDGTVDIRVAKNIHELEYNIQKKGCRGHKMRLSKLIWKLESELNELSLLENETDYIKGKIDLGRNMLDELLDIL